MPSFASKSASTLALWWTWVKRPWASRLAWAPLQPHLSTATAPRRAWRPTNGTPRITLHNDVGEKDPIWHTLRDSSLEQPARLHSLNRCLVDQDNWECWYSKNPWWSPLCRKYLDCQWHYHRSWASRSPEEGKTKRVEDDPDFFNQWSSSIFWWKWHTHL